MEVCEEGAALEERGGGVEVVAEEDVVVEERADGVEMVVDKESSLDPIIYILTTLSQFDPSPSGGVRPRLKLGISSNVFKYCSLLKMATSIVAIFFELHQNESWLQDASTSF
nr:hypothetical protein Iba_scaffold11704CG0020 [Ipomoea batatas]